MSQNQHDDAKHVRIITRDDLPLCCPMPNDPLWNQHPRVYLPIEDAGGSVACSYCGQVYLLKEDPKK